MARMRSLPIRSDPEFKRFIDEMRRFKSSQENEDITTARITKAMVNQYKKYPELVSEIKKKKLGRWNK